MKILFNPEEPDGAIIKNIYYKDELLFSSESGEEFEPGMVIQCEDDIADFLTGEFTTNRLGEQQVIRTGLFMFLKVMEPDEAKKYLEETKEKLKCGECDFSTRLKSRLLIHDKEHRKDKLVSNLGIPLIGRKAQRGAVNADLSDEEKVKRREKGWDEQEAQALNDGYGGLTGEGVRQDRPQKMAIMS